MRTALRWIVRVAAGLLIVLIAWLAVSASYSAYASARDARIPPPSGRRVDIGGRAMYLNCSGSGSPTVVLESALGAPSVLWQQIQPTVSARTRVCSYDRDGVGWSDESGMPRTVARFSDDLHHTLANAGETGPFVLVGHSIGGMLALDFARAFGNDVAGMVLIDPTHPRQFAPGGDQWKDHQQALPIFRAGPVLARLGIVREALWATDRLKPLPLPAATRETYISLMASPKGAGAMRHEAEALYSLADSSARFPALGDKPLLVLSASRTIDEGFPAALHDEMAKLSTRGTRRVVQGASHSGIVLSVQTAKVTAAAILEMVDSVRATTRTGASRTPT